MYLRQRDYDSVITPEELQQYIDTDAGIQGLAYLRALAQVKAKLKQKYYVDWEFTDTNTYTPLLDAVGNVVIYSGWSRVELNFPAYVPANTYNTGDPASNGTSQYIAKQNAITGAFDATKWFLIGQQYDLWYIPRPYPLFDENKGAAGAGTGYNIGDIVYWKGKIYQALKPTMDITHSDNLESIYESNKPRLNVFPDDPQNGLVFWGPGVNYNFTIRPQTQYTAWSGLTPFYQGNITINNNQVWLSLTGDIANPNLNNEPGASPLNWQLLYSTGIAPNIPLSTLTPYNPATPYVAGMASSYNNRAWISINGTATVPNQGNLPGTDIINWVPFGWTFGDNRDQLIVTCMLAKVVYAVTPRIAADQEPDTREVAMRQADKTLTDIEHGIITPDQLIRYEDNKGLTVSDGGITKNENTW